MSLVKALGNGSQRSVIAADAVAQAEAAVRSRPGFGGVSAQLGFETINRLRPGFLERHVHAMLPDMARAVEPHWEAGRSAGGERAHLVANAHVVTKDLLAVADAYVADATDRKAIAVYNQLRPRATRRIAEQMPRIAEFFERHTPPTGIAG